MINRYVIVPYFVEIFFSDDEVLEAGGSDRGYGGDEAEEDTENGEAGGSKRQKICCQVCNISFRNVTTLKKHVKAFHDKTNIKCEPCNKYFKCESDLTKHTKVHNGHPCECGKNFVTNDSLRQHRRRYHKKEVGSETVETDKGDKRDNSCDIDENREKENVMPASDKSERENNNNTSIK